MKMKKENIMALICIVIVCGCSLPNDAKMINRFKQKKPIFETIVQMVLKDKLDGALWISDSGRDPVTMPNPRAMEYKALLRQAGAIGVMRIEKGAKKGQIIFFLSTSFWSTEEKTYVYSNIPLCPLLESLDKGRQEFKPYDSYYKHIEDNWYLEYMNSNG
ncbi:MAG: hypothetical protein PHI84_20240 [Kiritimatiellae bacterium]|nr:hypothetical protein [Kiritimatiellia bacterium]